MENEIKTNEHSIFHSLVKGILIYLIFVSSCVAFVAPIFASVLLDNWNYSWFMIPSTTIFCFVNWVLKYVKI